MARPFLLICGIVAIGIWYFVGSLAFCVWPSCVCFTDPIPCWEAGMQEAQLFPVFYRGSQFWTYLGWIITGALPVGLIWEGVRGKGERLRKTSSISCVNCGKAMRYSFSKSQWVCDKCQTSEDGPVPIQSDADDEGTTWTYHPPPERKPETGVGSEAWAANRAREIRELREEERKKAAEWRKSHADA